MSNLELCADVHPATSKLRPTRFNILKNISVIVDDLLFLCLGFCLSKTGSHIAGSLQTGHVAKNDLKPTSSSIHSPSARITSVGNHTSLFMGLYCFNSVNVSQELLGGSRVGFDPEKGLMVRSDMHCQAYQRKLLFCYSDHF